MRPSPLVNGNTTHRVGVLGIPGKLNRAHPGAALIAHLSQIYPDRFLPRREAMEYVDIGRDKPHRAAAFEWLILRCNDTLPRIGWVVEDTAERYRLAEIPYQKERDI